MPPLTDRYAGLVLNTAGLVAYWPLREFAGTLARDLARGNRSGTYTASPTLGVAGPIGDSGMKLNGTTQYVSIPDDDAFSIVTTAQLTVEAWAQPSNTAGGDLCAKGTGANYEWNLYQKGSSTQWGFQTWTLAGADHCSPRESAVGTGVGRWVHVVGTITDSVSQNLFVNGVLAATIGTFSGSVGNGTSPVNIGRRPDNVGLSAAAMAHVAIYSRALTSGEVAAHYYAGLGS